MLLSPRLEEVIIFLWLLFHLKSFYKADNVKYRYDMFTFVFTWKKKKIEELFRRSIEEKKNEELFRRSIEGWILQDRL